MAEVPVLTNYRDMFEKLEEKCFFVMPEEAAKMIRASESMNAKKMRKAIDDVNKRYREDHKAWLRAAEKKVDKLQEEIKEEMGHHYQSLMYILFHMALRECGLSERTCKRVENKLAGTLNDLEQDVITMGDIKDYAEREYGFKIRFDVNREFIMPNIFETEVKD